MGEPPTRPASRVNGKVILAGPSDVGKTCLVERFVFDVYAADEPTHGNTVRATDCREKDLFVDSAQVHLFVYDTAGQERFADMAASYYRVGEVCLLCFDMANLMSFDTTKWWMGKIAEYNSKCSFILVGTKEDLAHEGMDFEPITRWAEENGIPFFATSALRGGANIKFLFHTVAEKCLRLSREKQLSECGGGGGARVRLRGGIGHPQKGCC